MTASPPSSTEAAARALVLRHIQSLITKTLAYFAQHQQDQLKAMRAHLFDMLDSMPQSPRAQHLRTAAVTLDKHAAVFGRSFQQALREAIEQELESVLPGVLRALQPAAGSEEASGPASMALLDVDAIERHLLVDRVAQRFNVRYDNKLTQLTQCLGSLLRIEEFSMSDNPFRPATFIRAFFVAWHLSEFDPEATEDFVLALEPQHSVDWAPLYSGLTETLVRAGFSAQKVHRIKRSAGTDSAPAPLRADSGPGGGPGSGHRALEPAGRHPGAGSAAAESAPFAWGDLAPAASRSIALRARQFLQKLGFARAPGADGSAQGSGGTGTGAGAGGTGGTGGPGAGTGGGPGASGTAGSGDGDGQDPGGVAGQTAAASMVPADPALMGFLGGLQAGAHAAPARPWIQGEGLDDQNVLRQMRDSEEVKRAPELDRGTVDALAEVFDFVFADQTIPTQLKVVIGRLQIPVLKAAMIDRDFFFSSEHPARKLVDALAAASVAWMPQSGESDPLYVCIETTVKRVLAEFDQDLNLFGELLAQFNAFLLAAERQAQEHIDPAASREQSSESLELALAHADEVVHQCVNALPHDEPLVPFLLPFLTTQWRVVMARAWLNADHRPGEWDDALATMDQVIWSTQSKTHPEDRARLMAMLPDLIRKLNASLDAIGWAGEDRDTFVRRLIATHVKAVRAPKTGPAPLDSGPGELEANAGRDALEALDDRRSRHATGESDAFDATVHGFVRGLWFDFAQDQQAPRRYRLSWVSPQRTRLLFTNRDGFEAFVHSEREVAALLREGRLTVIDQEPIVARAIVQIMSDQADPELQLA